MSGLRDRLVGPVVNDTLSFELVLEDADGVFSIHPVGVDGEVSERLLPVGGLSLDVWHVVATECAERLPDQRGVVALMNERELLHVVGVAVVDVTAVPKDVLLGVEFVGILTVDEVRLPHSNDVAMVFPEGNPVNTTLSQSETDGEVEGLLQRRVLLHEHVGPELMVALKVLELDVRILLAQDSELPIQTENRHVEVVLELRLHGDGVQLPIIPVGDAPQVHEVAEVDDYVPSVVSHVALDRPEGLLVFPRNVHVRDDEDSLCFQFLFHCYPH